ncbi:MAG: single-stranded DNA-binding protein [Pseudonocardiales bacterium]|nr:MAG: single-stranded DNA-binding protein [Pseudonocardiales bacterium]
MANETTVTITGTLTADPELRYTPSGVAVANFTIANNPRHFDKASGAWKDGDPLFLRCAIWRDAAENVTNSLSKGDRVIASGRLVQKSYETQAGEKRTSYELLVDEIGPSLKWATVKVTKASRSTSGGGEDPWTSGKSSAATSTEEDPPF